ncbi:MAG: hypothetical protein K5928_06150 [Prevotella sp.]|jgi:hypothetical protein|nr:hypothetical protein [Prevotella sp.]
MWILLVSLVVLGVVAALLSRGDDTPVVLPPGDDGNCSECQTPCALKDAVIKRRDRSKEAAG